MKRILKSLVVLGVATVSAYQYDDIQASKSASSKQVLLPDPKSMTWGSLVTQIDPCDFSLVSDSTS